MRRLIFALLLALFLFPIIAFVLSNRDDVTLGHEMVFKFKVPYLYAGYTEPVPVGYVILIAFCLGMVATPFLEAVPGLYKTLELRKTRRQIRQLERELKVAREMLDLERKSDEPFTPAPPSGSASGV